MKVVATDNLARDYVADMLIKENVTKEEGENIAKEHNDKILDEDHSGYYYIVVDDDYRLCRGMEDLV